MTPIFNFDGIHTPAITSHFEGGAINWDAVADVIDFLISAGVRGLITGGSTGENYTQTVVERLELAKFTDARIASRTSSVVGTGAMLTSSLIALAEGAKALDADAILLASPPTPCPHIAETRLTR